MPMHMQMQMQRETGKGERGQPHLSVATMNWMCVGGSFTTATRTNAHTHKPSQVRPLALCTGVGWFVVPYPFSSNQLSSTQLNSAQHSSAQLNSAQLSSLLPFNAQLRSARPPPPPSPPHATPRYGTVTVPVAMTRAKSRTWIIGMTLAPSPTTVSAWLGSQLQPARNSSVHSSSPAP